MEATDGDQIFAVLQSAAVLLARQLSYGQSRSAALVLTRLDDAPAHISVLAAATGVSQPSMTELVGRLESDGLVTRLSDPKDRRARGRAHRLELQRTVHDLVIDLLEAPSTQDRAALSLAMRVAAPLVEQLIQLATQHPHPLGDRAPVTI